VKGSRLAIAAAIAVAAGGMALPASAGKPKKAVTVTLRVVDENLVKLKADSPSDKCIANRSVKGYYKMEFDTEYRRADFRTNARGKGEQAFGDGEIYAVMPKKEFRNVICKPDESNHVTVDFLR
jgi:hypothetical protein